MAKTQDTEKKARVLIIDDDDFMAGIFATKLTKDGFDVRMAERGREGLKVAITWKPDAILLDVIMPEMDGFAVLKELKADAKTTRIPVFMLTSLGQQEDVRRALEGGARGYFVKTHTIPSDTTEAIRKALKARE